MVPGRVRGQSIAPHHAAHPTGAGLPATPPHLARSARWSTGRCRRPCTWRRPQSPPAPPAQQSRLRGGAGRPGGGERWAGKDQLELGRSGQHPLGQSEAQGGQGPQLIWWGGGFPSKHGLTPRHRTLAGGAHQRSRLPSHLPARRQQRLGAGTTQPTAAAAARRPARWRSGRR